MNRAFSEWLLRIRINKVLSLLVNRRSLESGDGVFILKSEYTRCNRNGKGGFDKKSLFFYLELFFNSS